MSENLVTITKYKEYRELTIGSHIPKGQVEMFTITSITDAELNEIMTAKSQDVQNILQRYI